MIIGNECDRKVTRSLSPPEPPISCVYPRVPTPPPGRGTTATFNQIGILCDLISVAPSGPNCDTVAHTVAHVAQLRFVPVVCVATAAGGGGGVGGVAGC